jgi:predicted hotdog family 3-hydroxylacyl-ACP dehydratase
MADRINAICRRPIADLVPHRPPMILIDEACGMEGDSFMAKVRITPQSPFFAAGGVPSWVGLEYMAQTVGAYSGALGLARGGTIRPGMLLGTRDYAAALPLFPEGRELEVLVRIDIFQEGGVSSMDCRIRTAGDGRPEEGGAFDGTAVELARAQITVIEVPDIRSLLKERSP